MGKQSLCTTLTICPPAPTINCSGYTAYQIVTGQRLSHINSPFFSSPYSRSSRREETLFPVSVAVYTLPVREIRVEDETLSPSHVIFQTQLFLPQSIQNTKQHFQFTVVPQRITSYPCNHGCMFPFPSVLRWS